MLKKGVSTERLSKMTGHASDEMIKRVYAQLTEDDEINLIESDLYSDMDDDVVNIPVDSSSNHPNESAAVISNESSVELSEAAFSNNDALDSIPTHHIDRNSYIKGLEDIVEKSLSQAESWYNGIDFSETDQIIEKFKQEESSFKKEIGDYFPETIGEAMLNT